MDGIDDLLPRLLKSGARLAVGVVGGIVLLVLGCQRSLIYYPRAYEAGVVDRAGHWVEPVSFKTKQGPQTAYYLASKETGENQGNSPGPGGQAAAAMPDRLWLVTGGNGALALDWMSFVRRAGGAAPADAFLLIDYPGYGECAGKPGPKSIRQTLLASVRQLAAMKGWDQADLVPRIAVLGHSIGAAVALIAAEQFSANRIVLVSPFTSMSEMARDVVGFPLNQLLLHRFNNRARLRALTANDGPGIVVFHGSEDSVIPVTMSRRLKQEFPDRITFMEINGAGHNDIFELAEGQILDAMLRGGGWVGRRLPCSIEGD